MVLNQFTVQKYDASYYELWNNFVAESRNGTFLFHRDFMEYHSDRFEDFSLLVFEDTDKLMAILPANRAGDEVFSHQGLTYGGVVYKDIKLAKVISIFKGVLFFLNSEGLKKIHIKSIPSIYHKKPAEELLYALFLTEAKLVRRDSLSVIDLTQKNKISKSRLENIRRGKKNNLRIVEDDNFELFWDKILIPNLHKKHGAKPVHSVKEILYLKSKFPTRIRHFNLYYGDEIMAGTTIFVTDKVIHPQYVSGNSFKNELGSLDYLYHHLITEVFKEYPFFDFGISNEEMGKKLNEGLCFWKETFGASTIVQDFYEVPTSNYYLLENVLI